MNGALILSWGRTVPGREAKALEVFAEAQQYWEDLEKKGEIRSHRPYFGPLRGAIGFELVDGEVERLQAVQRRNEFRRLVLRAGAIADDLRVDIVEGGDDRSVQELVTTFTDAISDLGYL